MKIIAKQVPPEYQDSNFDPDCWPEIIFHGNRHYCSHTTPKFDIICDRFDEEKRILRALHLVTGKRFKTRIIRGCSQSDWQQIYYPVDMYDNATLDILETDYFNTGTEWIIDPDGDAFSVYCYGWNPDQIRGEIADATGCNAQDVILYEFSGYTKTAQYQEVTV